MFGHGQNNFHPLQLTVDFNHVGLAVGLNLSRALLQSQPDSKMHAVYAGGSTPTPSPRVHRKQFGYGRPVMPGYSFPHKQSPLHHKSASKDSDDSSSKETNFRESIPAMCSAVAFTCLICNILVPGLGKRTYVQMKMCVFLSAYWNHLEGFGMHHLS